MVIHLRFQCNVTFPLVSFTFSPIFFCKLPAGMPFFRAGYVTELTKPNAGLVSIFSMVVAQVSLFSFKMF